MMKANHPADCMNCDANGRCEFQVEKGWERVLGCGGHRIYGHASATLSLSHAPNPAHSSPSCRLLRQDLIARYDVRDVLPQLKAYSHEWDEEVQVGAAAGSAGVLWVGCHATHSSLSFLPFLGMLCELELMISDPYVSAGRL